jgi:hypothetical protein
MDAMKRRQSDLLGHAQKTFPKRKSSLKIELKKLIKILKLGES